MFNKYKKALVIGAGSGRDIASSVLVTEQLKDQGIAVDLAGFLTPWALHTFDGRLEQAINLLTTSYSRKFIPTKENVSLDSYFEPELLDVNEQFDLGIGEVYLFSLQYGTDQLRSEIEKLVNNKEYDVIVVVDVGGDILARKKDLASVFTPIVDLSCLEIIANIHCSADRYVSVIAPGVDGELQKDQLQEIFGEYRRKKFVLDELAIDGNVGAYQKFKKVFHEINKRTNSTSHTGDMLNSLVEGTSILKEEYRRTLSLGDKKWDVCFPVHLDFDLATKMYYFDLNSVWKSKSEVKVSYNNMLEAFDVCKKLNCGGTEIDLSFIPGKIEQGFYRDCHLVLHTFIHAGSKKLEIIESGTRLLSQGKVGRVLVHSSDMPPSCSMSNLQSKPYGACHILYQ